MANHPPHCGARDAPFFDGHNPLDLPRYFEDIRYITTNCNLDNVAKIWYAKYYASSSIAELWDTTDGVGMGASDWTKVKEAIISFYLALEPGVCFTREDLNRLIEGWKSKGIQSREDFGEYKREFMVRSKYLEHNSIVSAEEAARMFVRAFTGKLKDRLQQRLEMKEPNPSLGQPYTIDLVVKHADYILAGTVFDDIPMTRAPNPTSQSKVKSEEVDIGTVWEVVKNIQVQVQSLGQRPPPATMSQRSPGCALCGDTSHYIRLCLKVLEYIQAEKCVRDANGKVTLPNGGFIPSTAVGNNLMEKIDLLHQETSTALVNLIEVATSTGMSTEVSEGPAMMVETVEEVSDKELEVAQYETLLNEAKKRASAAKKAKFDGVEIPVRPRPGPANVPTTLNAKSSIPKPAGNLNIPQESKLTTNLGRNQPQLRYVALIEDPATVQKVLSRTLDSAVMVTQWELLDLSSDMRWQMKELMTVKRYVVSNVNLVESDQEGSEVAEY